MAVSLAATPAALSCDPSGGSGSFTYVWGGACTGTGTSDNTCDVDNATTCQDETLNVQVNDTVCGLSNQPTGTYAKTTTVTTSVKNP